MVRRTEGRTTKLICLPQDILGLGYTNAEFCASGHFTHWPPTEREVDSRHTGEVRDSLILFVLERLFEKVPQCQSAASAVVQLTEGAVPLFVVTLSRSSVQIGQWIS